jgi:hypothetical protein
LGPKKKNKNSEERERKINGGNLEDYMNIVEFYNKKNVKCNQKNNGSGEKKRICVYIYTEYYVSIEDYRKTLEMNSIIVLYNDVPATEKKLLREKAPPFFGEG